MNRDMTLYQNRYRIESARFPGWDYRSRGWYFVTICSHKRAQIFGTVKGAHVRLSQIGMIADSELRSLSAHYKNVEVDTHVVMPNHVHAIIAIDGEHAFTPYPVGLGSVSGISPAAGSLPAIVRSYKAGVTRLCRHAEIYRQIWQTRFYDKILRSDAIIGAVREYIRNNPANWPQNRENIET